VTVPDKRLDLLDQIYKPEKVIPTTLQFVDIAGLVRGAAQGEGLGNQFLSHIQTVDTIIHLVRCFDNPNVAHIDEKLDPRRDYEIVETEILLKDLEIVESRREKLIARAKSGDEQTKKQLQILDDIRAFLIKGQSAKQYHAHPEEENFIRELALLSNKPVIIAGNISEDEAISGKKSQATTAFENFALQTGNMFVTISANLELELSELPPADRKVLMSEWHIAEPGLNHLIRAGYELLRLITFFTMESKIVQAWTMPHNTPAVKAAAEIHTGFEERFIKAEVRHWNDLEKLHSEHLLHEQGLIHIEGKSYIVHDGDVITFKLSPG